MIFLRTHFLTCKGKDLFIYIKNVGHSCVGMGSVCFCFLVNKERINYTTDETNKTNTMMMQFTIIHKKPPKGRKIKECKRKNRGSVTFITINDLSSVLLKLSKSQIIKVGAGSKFLNHRN